jgi:hypothetical protein
VERGEKWKIKRGIAYQCPCSVEPQVTCRVRAGRRGLKVKGGEEERRREERVKGGDKRRGRRRWW